MSFTIVPNQVWADRRLTHEQLRVLGALLSFCTPENRTCWPRRQLIADRSGVHIANVSSATTALEGLGWLLKDGKGGHSKATRYTIIVPETLAESATVADQATVADSARGMRAADQATVALSATVADSASSTVAESATRKEETREQTISTARHSRGVRLPDDWILPKAWGDWAIQEVPGWTPDQVRKVADVFRDYWHAKAGKDAVKTDWLATWRNWVRRDAEKIKPTVDTSSGQAVFRGAI